MIDLYKYNAKAVSVCSFIFFTFCKKYLSKSLQVQKIGLTFVMQYKQNDMTHATYTAEIYLDCEGCEYTVKVTGVSEEDTVNVLSYEIAGIPFDFELICMKFSDYTAEEIEQKAVDVLVEAVNLEWIERRKEEL